MVLPVALYQFQILSPTLKEECRLRVFENRALRDMDLRERRYQETAEKFIMKSLIICTPHRILRVAWFIKLKILVYRTWVVV
jgi:hypothetical protein